MAEKWIQKAIKHPGRLKNLAKREGISTQEAIQKAKSSKNPSLRRAGLLAITLAKLRKGKK